MLDASAVNISLKIILALITLSLGFGVKKSQVKLIFAKPKALIVGLISQMIFLPLLAFFTCLLFNLNPLFNLGIMIIAFCPGGTTSNLLSFLFKANVGLSISLTVLNGLLCMVTIPVFSYLSLIYFVDGTLSISFPFLEIIAELLLVIIIPGALGIFLNQHFEVFAEKAQSYLKIILPLLLAGIFAIKFFATPAQGGLSISKEDIQILLMPLFLINIVAITFGFSLAQWMKLSKKIGLTIAIETGLQNTALALLICLTAQNIEVQKPAVIYAAFSFFTTAFFALVLKQKVPPID